MKLVKGIGGPGEGACWMAAIHYYTRANDDQSWSDRPACVPETIRELAVSLNDWCEDNERESLLGDHLFDPVGCDRSPASETRRLEMIVETAITWARRMYPESSYGTWAERWLSGKDRSVTAAENAATMADGAAATAPGAMWVAAVAAATAAGAAAAMATAEDAVTALATSMARAAAAMAAVKAAPTKLALLGLISRCCAIGDRVETCAPRSRESVLEALETGNF